MGNASQPRHPAQAQLPRVVGRYALCDAIAAGGMATVHVGRLLGPVGFSRTVAIKRLHEQFAQSDEFVAMFLDEARLVARIRHPNVVPTLDIVATAAPPELFLVMEYVTGESLAKILRGANEMGWRMPPRIVASIVAAALHGLHAAHEAKDERGNALGIVHRDVSPQNILVGTDGVPRILDFGVAKAAGRVQTTQAGQLKGKLAYMAPEQVRSDIVSRQTDVYAASIVLWEALTGQRLYTGSSDGAVLAKVLEGNVEVPSKAAKNHPIRLDDDAMQDLLRLDAIVMHGLAHDPAQRFQTAREMALLLESSIRPATAAELATWVEASAKTALAERAARIERIERDESLMRLAPLDEASGNVRMIAARSNGAPTPEPPRVSDPGQSGRFNPPQSASGVGQVRSSISTSGVMSPHMPHPMTPPPPPVSSPMVGAPPSGQQVGNAAGVISGVSQVSVASQLSGIAMTSSQGPAPLPAKSSKLPLFIAGGAALFGVGLALVLAAVFRSPSQAEAEPPPPSTAAASPGAPNGTNLPTTPPTTTATAVASASDTPTAPTATATATAAPSATATATAVSPPTDPTSKPRPHGCSPPYTTDGSGIRHYKPWCI